MLLVGVAGVLHAGASVRDPGGEPPPPPPGSARELAHPATTVGQPSGSAASFKVKAPGAVDTAPSDVRPSAPSPAPFGSSPSAVPLSEPSTSSALRVGRWAWPLDPRPVITRGFEPPSERWSAGHRGVDLTPRASGVVHAVDDGIVTHVGTIAGRPTISITHASGTRSTYEPVASELTRGSRVARGAALGNLVDAGSHCTPKCLHLGAIRDDTYLNPLLLLEPMRIVLLPLGAR